jgi:putative ABC transport system permease protein
MVAYLVAVVSAAGVLVAIYNSMASRRRDIAILRALGAGRLFLFGAIVLEATAIGAIGMAVAFVAYAGIVSAVAVVIQAQTGVLLETFAYSPVMLWAPLGMIALCSVCGLLPAWKAYRTDVAENLSPIS